MDQNNAEPGAIYSHAGQHGAGNVRFTATEQAELDTAAAAIQIHGLHRRTLYWHSRKWRQHSRGDLTLHRPLMAP